MTYRVHTPHGVEHYANPSAAFDRAEWLGAQLDQDAWEANKLDPKLVAALYVVCPHGQRIASVGTTWRDETAEWCSMPNRDKEDPAVSVTTLHVHYDACLTCSTVVEDPV